MNNTVYKFLSKIEVFYFFFYDFLIFDRHDTACQQFLMNKSSLIKSNVNYSEHNYKKYSHGVILITNTDKIKLEKKCI